jgi:hypothetical protein
MRAELRTVIHGDNADLIAEVAKLYLSPSQTVLDVTYGKGVFWRKVDVTAFDFHGYDIAARGKQKGDFKRVKAADESVDHVIFDPPYMHNPGKPMVNARYRNRETHTGKYHADILRDYRIGMSEAYRILRRGGLLWVKCQDEIESGLQRWSHIEIYLAARRMGFLGKDLFLLVPHSRTPMRHTTQLHARKAHSYLWLLEKPTAIRAKQAARDGID